MIPQTEQKSLLIDIDRTLSRIRSVIETKRGLLNPDTLNEYDRIKLVDSRETRAAMADQLVTILARRLQESWPILYESLTLIRDFEIYKQPEWLSGRSMEPFGNFESYFVDRMGKPFDLFLEMEATYHFAEQYHPKWKDKPFSEASILTKREKGIQTSELALAVIREAEESNVYKTQEQVAREINKSQQRVSQVEINHNFTSEMSHSDISLVKLQTKSQLAAKNGVSRSTQHKLDTISRHPDLTEAIHGSLQSGMSVSRAYDVAREREGKPRNHIAPILRQFDKLSEPDKILTAESILQRLGWKRG